VLIEILVFDILLTYISDWKQALKANIPERKGWVVKQQEGRSRTSSVICVLDADSFV
jgi:hypothetical protein